MSESKVFMFDNDDPEMQRAYETARSTFRYFWREVAWERRRIVPGLDLACVKAPFSDGGRKAKSDGTPQVEQMWLSDIDFDGRTLTGTLLNTPNWLKSIKAGDTVSIPLDQISDWMYAIGGEVFGAFTVNLMRSRMGRTERRQHDDAWGLDFGDPAATRVVPQKKNWFGKGDIEEQEHPMSESMAPSFEKQLQADPTMARSKSDEGWTFLHQQALAGSLATVKVLLEAGADANAVTDHGMTPLQLAESLGWEKVIALLKRHGAKG